MKFTENLKIFSVLVAAYSGLYFYVLYESIAAKNIPVIIGSTVAFGVLMWVTAWRLGKYDDQSKTRLNLGFMYHFVTYIIVNAVHVLWFAAGWTPEDYAFWEFILSPLGWGFGLFIHFLVTKSSIKDYPKKRVFD